MVKPRSLLLLVATVGLTGGLCGQETRPLSKLSVRDSSLYSSEYLKELETSGIGSSITIVDSMMIVGGMDTVFFPTHLSTDRWYVFSASSINGLIELRVMRLNYTNIRYELWIEKKKHEEGEVIGGPGILAAEIDEDDRTHTAYGATEYSACSLHCCRSIRMGMNDGNELLARFMRHCDLPERDIVLGDLPTLRLAKEVTR
jgi:hypothetical protein